MKLGPLRMLSHRDLPTVLSGWRVVIRLTDDQHEDRGSNETRHNTNGEADTEVYYFLPHDSSPFHRMMRVFTGARYSSSSLPGGPGENN